MSSTRFVKKFSPQHCNFSPLDCNFLIFRATGPKCQFPEDLIIMEMASENEAVKAAALQLDKLSVNTEPLELEGKARKLLSDEDLPEPKEVTAEEIEQILARQNGRKVTEFEASKLEKEAKKNWDLFYKRNETRFFKDRHWTLQEFEEVGRKESPVLLEVGCGCGNFIFPMLEEMPKLRVLACDFSPRAVDFVKSHEHYDEKRIRAFVCDITQEDCFQPLNHLKFTSDDGMKKVSSGSSYETADFLSLIFVLSSISPGKQKQAIDNVAKAVKPGGIVFFRDYGRHDMAQLRFKGGKKIEDNFYARRDGTRAYYFTPEEVLSFFENVGFRKLQCEFVHRRTVNVKQGVNVERTFVQGKFIKE